MSIENGKGASTTRKTGANDTRVNNSMRNNRGEEGRETKRNARNDTTRIRIGVVERVVEGVARQDRGQGVDVTRMAMGLLYADYVIGLT